MSAAIRNTQLLSRHIIPSYFSGVKTKILDGKSRVSYYPITNREMLFPKIVPAHQDIIRLVPCKCEICQRCGNDGFYTAYITTVGTKR